MTKKIFISIDWFLPGTAAGGPVRSIYNLVQQLKGYEFYILTSNTDYNSSVVYEGIKANTWTKFNENTSVYYSSHRNQNVKQYSKLLKAINPDFVYIQGMYSSKFSILPIRAAKKLQKPIVVAPRGMLSQQSLRHKTLKKRVFIWVAKNILGYNNLNYQATNEDEKNDIHNAFGRDLKVSICSNLPSDFSSLKNVSIDKESGKLSLFFLGRIAIEKGLLEALKSLEPIKDGEVNFSIYGAIYDKSYWKKCQELITTLPQNIKVEYKGAISFEEVPKVISGYHYMFLPSHGENFGHSIIESLSLGVPVLTSNHTPWNHLEKYGAGFNRNHDEWTALIMKLIQMDGQSYSEFRKKTKLYAQSKPELLNLRVYYKMFE